MPAPTAQISSTMRGHEGPWNGTVIDGSDGRAAADTSGVTDGAVVGIGSALLRETSTICGFETVSTPLSICNSGSGRSNVEAFFALLFSVGRIGTAQAGAI